jgi:hypothetical protein
MTAVLSAVDALRRDTIMTALDDNQIQYVALTLPQHLLQLTPP